MRIEEARTALTNLQNLTFLEKLNDWVHYIHVSRETIQPVDNLEWKILFLALKKKHSVNPYVIRNKFG